MAEVVLKNVTKVFDKEVVAVKEANLEVADKEFVVLVGPSGCGKSTTLRKSEKAAHPEGSAAFLVV